MAFLKYARNSHYSDLRELLDWFAPYLETNYFQSIDLYTTEFAQPIENFREIYQLAKDKGMKRKAHIGESGAVNG